MADTIVLGQAPHRLSALIVRGAVTGYTLTFTDPDGTPSTIEGTLQLEVEGGPTWVAAVTGNVATWTLSSTDTAVDFVTRRIRLVRVLGEVRDVIAVGWVFVDA